MRSAIAARLMERLWRRASDDVAVAAGSTIVAARWIGELPRDAITTAGLERSSTRPLDAICARCRRRRSGVVLCHQDLHGGNILRAEREPWLAIDPKPIVAERAYDTVRVVRDATDRRSPQLRRRLDLLSERLGLDRERMRLWGLASAGLGQRPPARRQLFSEVGSS